MAVPALVLAVVAFGASRHYAHARAVDPAWSTHMSELYQCMEVTSEQLTDGLPAVRVESDNALLRFLMVQAVFPPVRVTDDPSVPRLFAAVGALDGGTSCGPWSVRLESSGG